MRITKISLKNFRAFRGPDTIDLYRSGHNLVVYGENGSGKSSLYQALNLFLEPVSKRPDFKSQKNIFVDGDDGFVELMIGTENEGSNSFQWTETSDPYDQELILEASKTKGFIDYRSLLTTSFLHQSEDVVNVFDLVVKTLLANTQNPISQIRFGEEWAQIEKLLQERSNSRLVERLTEALDTFNDGLLTISKELIKKTNEILEGFQQGVTINLQPQTVGLETKPKKNLINKEICLQVTYYRRQIDHHHLFLNEARLSAIGLSIYLASLLLNPGSQLKILVLDDVLIGLDMSNRLPLLDILYQHFRDWQIILITYDRTWYDIIRQRTNGSGWNWEMVELYCGKTDEYEFPVYTPGKTNLQRAQEHLDGHDLKAAVIYLRKGFEQILKSFSNDMRLKVCYKEKAKDYTTNDFWDVIKNEKNKDGQRYLDPEFVREVELYRSLILNPLSHDAVINPIKREVQEAITTINKLKSCLDAIVSEEKKRANR